MPAILRLESESKQLNLASVDWSLIFFFFLSARLGAKSFRNAAIDRPIMVLSQSLSDILSQTENVRRALKSPISPQTGINSAFFSITESQHVYIFRLVTALCSLVLVVALRCTEAAETARRE